MAAMKVKVTMKYMCIKTRHYSTIRTLQILSMLSRCFHILFLKENFKINSLRINVKFVQ